MLVSDEGLAKAMHLMRSSAFLISLIFPTVRSKRIHSEGTSALLVSNACQGVGTGPPDVECLIRLNRWTQG